VEEFMEAPQYTGEVVGLLAALSYSAWHGRHHTAQVAWLREQNGW
jgi:hypothetical protein